MAKANTSLAVTASEEELALLASGFPPEEDSFERNYLPRLGMFSQDQTEEKRVNGKKVIEVVTEAGTFYTEIQSEEEDLETGKKPFIKTEIGDEAEGIIFFKRRQLKHYDEDTERYTQSPVFDTDEDIVPLWCEGAEVDKGTPADLKKKYMFTGKDAKPKCSLEENIILYVLYNGEPYQMNLRGSSMYSFKGYGRKVQVPTVLTRFTSSAQEKGDVQWNRMDFEAVRKITKAELQTILAITGEMKEAIAAEKKFFAARNEADDTFNSIKGKDEEEGEEAQFAEGDLPFNEKPKRLGKGRAG